MAVPEIAVAKIVTYSALFGLLGIALGTRFRKNIGGALLGYAASQVLALVLLVQWIGD